MKNRLLLLKRMVAEAEGFRSRSEINGIFNELINLNFLIESARLKKLGDSRERVSPKNTSVSDANSYSGYLNLVNQSLKDQNVFRHLRTYSEYRAVLEHVTHPQGVEYLKQIIDSASELRTILNEIDCSSESIRYRYRSFGSISPSLLRYGHIALLIRKFFGSTFRNVYEVGCGYGGQALVLDGLISIDNYFVHDLETVESLTLKFISHHNVKFNLKLSSRITTFPDEYDLFISNYAFSELNRPLQEEILAKIISKSANGFMLLNVLGEQTYLSMKYEEMLKRIPRAELLEEIPNTAPGNALLIWRS